jgi:hypothetical protein
LRALTLQSLSPYDDKTIALGNGDTTDRAIVFGIQCIGQAEDAGQQRDPMTLRRFEIVQFANLGQRTAMKARYARHHPHVL